MAIMLQRKPTPLQSWHLTDQAQMLSALSDLSDDGWRGTVARDPEADTWRIELNTNGHPTVMAVLGDWLVLDGDLKAMSAEAREAAYDEVD